ncbi:MAG TPA: aldo/keto reductase [Planctomycetaceae bacterium]|nr:aldo/keto reductase [Planctomycetaceae bacterium]HIQ22975.1 aldo/keto reductase [Planctomycetota bacterium]
MSQGQSRRTFLKTTSVALAAGTVAPAAAADTNPSGILNYNPKMTYRRLGKTDFMISEIALGGHGAAGPDRVANRVAVLERAVQLGMNYVDNNIATECDLYGEAMARSRTAGRDKWFIGFASWPQKVTEEYENELTPEKMMGSIEDRLRSYRTDMLDMWRPVGATWGEGQTNIATMYMVTHRTLDMVVGVFEKARQQGKVRFLGISAHNPKVFRRVLNEYPQFSVIIFPYLFLTKEFGGHSLLQLAKEKDVGVIGLKPFGAGTVFGLKPQQLDRGLKTDPKAHLLVKEMLQEKRISAIIPGVNTPQHLDENVKGSYLRDQPKTPEEEHVLEAFRRNFYANLTPGYRWLRQWEVV